MQHTLVERERTPDSPTASTRQTLWKTPERRRLYFYLLQSTLLITLTSITFYHGVVIIRQNARALGFFALNFDVPLPFLLIGLWGLVVVVMATLSFVTLVKMGRLLVQQLRRSLAQRAAI